MRSVSSMAFTILTACFGASGQTSPPACPSITFTSPTSVLVPGESSTFEPAVSGGGSSKLSFVWGSSAGKLLSPWSRTTQLLIGQEDQGINIMVFVKVEGLPEGCPNIISDVFGVAPAPIIDYPDGFGQQTDTQMKGRIDNLFIVLNHNPEYEGIIALHYGEKDLDSKLTDRVRQVMDVVRFRKYDVRRLSFLIPENPSRYETIFYASQPASDLVPEQKPYGVIKAEKLLRNYSSVLGKRVYTYKRKFK